MQEGFWAGIIVSILLIVGGICSIYMGDGGYHRGYPVPLWGAYVFLAVGIIILIILIQHWRKQRKNPTPVSSLEDESDANTDVEELEHTHAAEDTVDHTKE